MEITQATVAKIAHLSRLEISPEEAAAMQTDLTKILNWMEQLNEVDTVGIEPLTHMSHEVNVLRADEAKNTLPREAGLKNAPNHTENYFTVPKVVE